MNLTLNVHETLLISSRSLTEKDQNVGFKYSASLCLFPVKSCEVLEKTFFASYFQARNNTNHEKKLVRQIQQQQESEMRHFVSQQRKDYTRSKEAHKRVCICQVSLKKMRLTWNWKTLWSNIWTTDSCTLFLVIELRRVHAQKGTRGVDTKSQRILATSTSWRGAEVAKTT